MCEVSSPKSIKMVEWFIQTGYVVRSLRIFCKFVTEEKHEDEGQTDSSTKFKQ